MTNGAAAPKLEIVKIELRFQRDEGVEASRHSQMQRMAAMMSATQLTPIGI